MNILSTSIRTLYLFGFVFFVAFSLSVHAQNPTQNAPNANAAPPINVSGSPQQKTGGIQVGAAIVDGGLRLGNLNIASSGTCASGTEGSVVYVNGAIYLCADANAISQGTSSEIWTANGSTVYYDSGGVAIGTDTLSPNTVLTVAGNIGTDAVCDALGNNCVFHSDIGRSPWSTSANNLFYDSGSIGIGTEFPSNLLTIELNTAGDTIPFAIKNVNAGNNAVGIELSNGVARSVFQSDRTSGAGADIVLNTTNNAGILNEVLRVTNTGNVGIGDSSPDGLKLDVAGNIGANQYCDQNGANCILAASLGDSEWTASSSDIYRLGGNVGIGVTNPLENLHTNLNIRADGGHIYSSSQDLFLGNSNGGMFFDSNQTDRSWFALRGSLDNFFGALYGFEGGYIGILDDDSDWAFLHEKDERTELRVNNLPIMSVLPGGVSVGTTTLSSGLELDVNGDVGANSYCDENGANCFTSSSVGGLWTANGANINRTTGNVGIGEPVPVQKLDVAGNALVQGGSVYLNAVGSQELYGDNNRVLYYDSNNTTSSQFALRGSSNDLYGSLRGNTGDFIGILDGDNEWAIQHQKDTQTNWRINNVEQMRLTTTGLGLGDDTPTSRLQVGSNTAVDADNFISFGDRVTTTQTNEPFIGQDSYDGTANDLGLGAFSTDGGINFYTGIGSRFAAGARQMRLNADGDLSIGENNADAALKLDVEGQIGATGYCDENGANCQSITDLINSGADNLGNHIASTTLDLNGNGITGLDLAGGGISGTNFNISGVNQIDIADPGEGINFNTTANRIYLVDDATDDNINIASNRVGIGETSPSSKLDVAGNITAQSGHFYSPTQDLYLDSANNGLYFDSDDASISQLVLRDSGNVVKGRLYGTDQHFGLLDADGNWAMQHDTDAYTIWRINNAAQMRLVPGGLAIGGTALSGSLALDVSGQVGATEYCDAAGANCFSASDVSGAGGGSGPIGGVGTNNFVAKWTAGGTLGNSQIFDDGSQIGIGDPTPDGTLILDAEGAIGATEYCDQNGANCVAAGALSSVWTEVAGEASYAGNVGVGIVDPVVRLDVLDTTGIGTDLVRIRGESNALVIGNSGTGDYFLHNTEQDNGIFLFDGTGGLGFSYNGAEVVSIDNSGGLEVETGNLRVKTGSVRVDGGHVYLGAAGVQDLYGDNDSALYFDSNNSGTSQILLRDAENTVYGRLNGSSNGGVFGLIDGDGSWIMQHQKDVQTNWQINGSEQMRLTTTGLGLGVNDPESKLEIAQAGGNALYVRNTTNTGGARIKFSDQNTEAQHGFLEYVHADTASVGSGNAFIFSGTETSMTLKVDGKMAANQYCDENGANCLAITTMGADNLGNHLATTGIGRSAHNVGHLVGSYNNVAANGSRTNPIYTIGSSYNPAVDTLGNMYGIGFNEGSQSAIITGTASGWGLYVAADGDARTFLGAGAGSYSYINKNGGRLGIGTDSPSALLDVAGAAEINGLLDVNGNVEIGNAMDFYSANSAAASPDIEFNGSGLIVAQSNLHFMMDSDNNDNDNRSIFFAKNDRDTSADQILMEIEESGDVGIGNTNPGAKLDVTGTIRSTGNYTINNGSPTVIFQDTNNRSAMAHVNSNLFYVLSGSGTNATNWTQQANSRWPMTLNMANNNAVFGANVNAISFTQASDVRLKKDISTVSGLDTIMQLRGVDFTWKESGKKSVGLIAQEVEQVLPELVTETEITDPETGKVLRTEKAVEYANLVAPLIEAVKEQQGQIETLESRIKQLESQL